MGFISKDIVNQLPSVGSYTGMIFYSFITYLILFAFSSLQAKMLKKVLNNQGNR